MNYLESFCRTLGLTAFVALASSAHAKEVYCAQNVLIRAAISDQFKEDLVFVGLSTTRQVIQIYSSSLTGSWTLVGSHQNGQSCILATGHGDFLNDLKGYGVAWVVASTE